MSLARGTVFPADAPSCGARNARALLVGELVPSGLVCGCSGFSSFSRSLGRPATRPALAGLRIENRNLRQCSGMSPTVGGASFEGGKLDCESGEAAVAYAGGDARANREAGSCAHLFPFDHQDPLRAKNGDLRVPGEGLSAEGGKTQRAGCSVGMREFHVAGRPVRFRPREFDMDKDSRIVEVECEDAVKRRSVQPRRDPGFEK